MLTGVYYDPPTSSIIEEDTNFFPVIELYEIIDGPAESIYIWQHFESIVEVVLWHDLGRCYVGYFQRFCC